ncbi:MAG: MBL fold metallo-hydrolase [Clostridiales bacterium]|nr:MBL fold metallo-hydrolase [Clostridiales bacterium]
MTADQIEEVLQGIYRIPVPLAGNPLKELNSYCIRGKGNKSLLIDTGFHTEECKQAVEEGLSFLGIRMEETDILLTHFHADHSGNAPDLICGDNQVYISRVDKSYLEGTKNAENGGTLHELRARRLRENGVKEDLIREMFTRTPSRALAGDLSYKDYVPLDEGDELTAGDYRLRAIYVPGHTPGQMCFEIVGTGAMVLGDHVLFDITPNITDWSGVADALGDYLNSLDKIDRYDVTIPLPGHRKPGDFHKRIAELKEHHARRLEECRNVIRKLGKARLYDITGGMTWKIRAASWDDFPAAQRWFALGECLSHIDYLKRRGRITEHRDEEGYWYEA